jgi:hypothetical protein
LTNPAYAGAYAYGRTEHSIQTAGHTNWPSTVGSFPGSNLGRPSGPIPLAQVIFFDKGFGQQNFPEPTKTSQAQSEITESATGNAC